MERGNSFLATLVSALALGALSALPAGVAQATALEPLAVRSLMLAGGGRVQVATRYHLADYHAGEAIELDPVLESVPGAGGHFPVILEGTVEVRPHGYAPCLTEARNDPADCVEGSSPTPLTNGSPSRFTFSFTRLFRTSNSGTDGEAEHSSNYFGYASFQVSLEVVAADGTRELLSFPVTVTAQQGEQKRAEATISHPEVRSFPSTFRSAGMDAAGDDIR